MHRVLSRDQIRSFDRIAIESLHVPGVILMENAGRGAAEVIRSLITNEIDHVLIVCGTGNNGGDGFVVARHLAAFGASVAVCLLGDPAKLQGDAKINHDAFVGLSGHVTIVDDEASLPVLETALLQADMVVDAIFGTGLDREVQGRFAQAIDRMNATPAVRVALDLPSGLDANTGAVLGTAIVADATITFGALKLGLLTPMGSRLCGEIHVAGLGVPMSIVEQTGHEAEVLIGSRISAMIDRFRDQSLLLDEGATGIFVASETSAWAARLAARAALRTASGKVIVFGVPNVLAALGDLAADVDLVELNAKQPCKSLADAWSGCESIVFPAASPDDLPAIKQARKDFEGTVIIHASRSLEAKSKHLAVSGGDVALIVDPATLGALLGKDEESVEADRFSQVRAAADAAEATVVLFDTQPVVAVPGSAMGVLGKRMVACDSAGARVVASGVAGRIACWSEASVAVLGGMHLVIEAVESWLSENKGRGGPMAEEIVGAIVRRG